MLLRWKCRAAPVAVYMARTFVSTESLLEFHAMRQIAVARRSVNL